MACPRSSAPAGGSPPPSLVLGPMLRHIGETDATIWVETDSQCEVEVLGHRERTFRVEDRHYAIVAVEGLEAGEEYPYEVELDGRRVWPDPAGETAPSVIRTADPDRPLRLAFGSCRVTAPHHPPFTDRRASDRRGRGIDALRTMALRALRDPGQLPDALLMLGDQLYADDLSPSVERFARSRQVSASAPANQLEDFAEYAFAYCTAWSDPAVRWLLSTVPTAMIFDDHEIHDEWKISQSWVDEMRAQEWYERRITAGLMTYWLYQHLGNLSPRELAENELLRRAREADDAAPLLHDFARQADLQHERSRWSFCRDFGATRLVVLDSRAGRVLEPGKREILDQAEWSWIEERARGGFDHLLLASSIPFFLTPGLHSAEAWCERVCEGAWGARWARWGERLRRRANLGHWAAFQRSFRRLCRLLERIASGELGRAPRSVILLSGDVHHCYLAEVDLPGEGPPVWQAVCSGMRKQLDPTERLAMRVGNSRWMRAFAGRLASAVGVQSPPLDWRLVEGPAYGNQIAMVTLDGREDTLTVETTVGADWRDPRLRTVFERRLATRRVEP